nr:zinc finger, CCHC-type [Tanacetum cinerariifolium]
MAMVQAKEAGSMSYQVSILTATNYPVWAIKVKSILDAHGLLETVEPRTLGEELDTKKSKQALAFLLKAYEERLKSHGEKEGEQGQLLWVSEEKHGESSGRGRGRGRNFDRGGRGRGRG